MPARWPDDGTVLARRPAPGYLLAARLPPPMVDWTAVRAGLAETRPYLLSHHEPSEHYRCYAPVLLGRRVHLCARCSGVYPGITAGLLAVLVGPPSLASLTVVAVLPLPALGDWAATTFTARRGSNPIRTATGAALGYGYAVGLGRLFLAGDLRVLAIGAVYGLVAAGLLARSRADDGDAGSEPTPAPGAEE